jgi:predicted RNase H-like HicB family nuclease
MQVKIEIEKGEDGYYVVTVPSLPGCVSQGKTIAEAKRNIKDAIQLHLKCLFEDGIQVSPPSKKVRHDVVTVEI